MFKNSHILELSEVNYHEKLSLLKSSGNIHPVMLALFCLLTKRHFNSGCTEELTELPTGRNTATKNKDIATRHLCV